MYARNFVRVTFKQTGESCDLAFPSHVVPHSFAFSINVSRTLLVKLDGCCNLIWYTFAELDENYYYIQICTLQCFSIRICNSN